MLISLLIVQVVKGQGIIEGYLTELKEGQDSPFPYQIFDNTIDPLTFFETAKEYSNDSAVVVREAVYHIYYEVLSSNESHPDATIWMDELVRGVLDTLPQVRLTVLQYLHRLDILRLSDTAKQTLIQGLQSSQVGLDQLVLLIGRLDQIEHMPEIRPFITANNSQKVRWATYLALCRLGDRDATEWVKSRLTSYSVDEDWIFGLLPDAVYTRNKNIFDILVSSIQSDQQNCLPGDPDDTRKINCAYRILEQIAALIVDFPLTRKESGDLDTSDYEKALETARRWFLAHSDFEIVRT